MTLTIDSLAHFYGTEQYHRWSILFRNCLATDGVIHVAEAGGAYWLLDLIASHVPSVARKDPRLNEIQFWRLRRKGKGCVVECRPDADLAVVCSQNVEYTDFPLDVIDIWVAPQYNEKGEKSWVFMLPTEN